MLVLLPTAALTFAMVYMEIDHEIGYKTNIYAGLELDEVCLKKQNTGEEPGIQIG